MDRKSNEPARLRRDVEGALDAALDVTRILPLLHRLARTAADDSEDGIFAHRQLAELLAERSPWRASLHAKRVLRSKPDDDRGWAALGFCQTLLGNYRFAATSYEKALNCSPSNAWYSHNLGHLLDVALGEPNAAVVWLARAHAERPESREIVSSLVHALARAGQLEEARRVLLPSMKRKSSREHAALLAWIDSGAPAIDRRPREERPSTTLDSSEPVDDRSEKDARGVRRLIGELDRGMRNLPLDLRQRARARSLARDVATERAQPIGPEPRGLAAAVAFAIVEESSVPLSLSEVAACYRVGARTVRSHFAQLRTRLLRLGPP